MKFSDIPSHVNVKRQLRDMVEQGRVPHALLLHGPSGSGKFLLARALAQYLHCENPTADGEPCGVCRSCLTHQAGTCVDLVPVFPVVKTEKLKEPVSDDYLEEFRDFMKASPYMDFEKWTAMFDRKNAQPQIYVYESASLERRMALSATASRYKIVLMWLPERMNEQAANKLLKLIEEPADDTVFILVSNDADSVLPTIRSRCRPIEVTRLDDDTVADYLTRRLAMDRQDALAVAHIAAGDINAAMRSADATSVTRMFFDYFVRLMRLAYQRDVKGLLEWSGEVATMGREQQVHFYDYCQRLIRENFVYNLNVPSLNYMTRTESQFSQRFARFITERNAEALIRHMSEASADIAGNANAKIVNFDFAIKTIILIKNY
ncbi:MAG: AAA family ATPase [Duncaniella sp.]|nr:AAA family ATPase [Duncaniella sp.]